ncbi:hypothetical protein Goklo_025077 [Gossypium klotzschianum]|uniref:Uncharacterized protein n=1 Tax=Gossypium klotzschianum TaxID=34286 RepID=A0A7J8WDA6_9ROSI|nr:hypothetical protein [Gossypium klotzschianum]
MDGNSSKSSRRGHRVESSLVAFGQDPIRCSDFDWGDGYKKKIREMSNAWNQTHQMKRLAMGQMTTPEYNEWWVRRINDNTPKPS